MMRAFARFAAALLVAALPLTAQAAGSVSDQYKQMGSIAAVAELCLLSQAVPEALKRATAAAERKDPRVVPLLRQLIEAYNAAYIHAAQHQTIWDGTRQAYSQVPLDCTDTDDRDQLQHFETLIVRQLNGN